MLYYIMELGRVALSQWDKMSSEKKVVDMAAVSGLEEVEEVELVVVGLEVVVY